ncbi:MAG: hypothetical protein K9J74_07080 [Sulfuritalea sp.]|nr:hypothetical protein [Sulfuritalea sp.]
MKHPRSKAVEQTTLFSPLRMAARRFDALKKIALTPLFPLLQLRLLRAEGKFLLTESGVGNCHEGKRLWFS